MFRVLQYTSLMIPFTISILAIVFLSILYKWHSKKTLNHPPSPPSIPIIGNMHQLGSLPHRSLEALSRRHDRDLMLLHIGSVPVVVFSSSKAAREVMKTHDLVFANRPKALAFEKLLYNYGDIASAPYGEYWRQIKSVAVLHLLTSKRVHSFRRVREEETKLMVDKIRQCCHNPAVNLSELFVGLTYDVICRVALGRKDDDDGEIGRKIKKIVAEVTELAAGFNVGDYIPLLSWWSRVNGVKYRMERVAKEVDEFLEGVLEERERLKDEDDKNIVDILLRILRENSLGFPLSRVAVKAILFDMLVNGTDTTYISLETTMVLLLLHPNCMKQLQTEVRSIVGDKNNDVTEDDIKKMPYLNAVIKETLRLHPPAPLLLRRFSTRDVKIMGYDIVSGTQAFINVWAIGRDPSTWDNPEEFRPERFLDSEVDYKGHDFELIPFGAGRRGCPGIQFATTVNEIALASVVHRFDWSLPDSGLDMAEINGVTVHRKFPLMALPQLAR